MKKIYPYIPAVSFFLLFFTHVTAGYSQGAWVHQLEPQKVFILNKGQFQVQATDGFDPTVLYGYDGGEQNFYFTPSGVVYELVNITKPKERESEEHERKEMMKKGMTAEKHAEMEAEERRLIRKRDELRAQWIGADPGVQIIAEDVISATYSYSFYNKDKQVVNQSQIPAYRKITYKNLYPNIDVVYEIHDGGGVKYSVVVHPGGDISRVKLQYSKNAHLQSDGNIRTHTRLGNFLDHAPVTFYEEGRSPIASSYIVKGNVISFAVGDHDPARTIVIDPWTQTPAFASQWHCVWECDKDSVGNVYIIGGVTPMQLLKYNAAGALQWTYSTPYDTTSWLGTFAVDKFGNSYVTCGSIAAIQKVNTSGALVWNNGSPGGLFASTEFWSISFNCDQTQLVIGGTGNTLPPQPYIYNMNMATGNVLNSRQVTGGALFPTQEVRAITACSNGNYYYLTHDSIGYIHDGLISCLPPGSSFPFHVSNGYGLSYKCENWRYNNTGIAAIKVFGGFVYTHRGNQVHKRNFYTGSIIATGTISGGGFTSGQVTCSGIDIDSCGNVYCGSVNSVIKFDGNLNQLATYPTSFSVYDVAITSTGDLIASGSTGNQSSGARTGYVQSFAANACKPLAVVCCDASICPHAPVCTTDPAFTFTSTTPGGVWSGVGITNTTNGTFNPSVAGVGTFTIYYTLPCGRDSTTITVNLCTAVTLCRNGNPGTLTVSGGTAPYTWQVWDSIGRTCQGGIVIFGNCTGTWVTTYGWRTFSTGSALTVTPPAGTDTLRVTDNAGTTVTSWNITTLPPCNPCSMVVSPGATRNVSCFGGNNGVAHATVSGGTTPYTYAWTGSASTVDSASNLAQGTYTVTVHDVNGCSGTATFSITQPASAVTAAPVMTQATCGNNNGKVVLHASGGTPGYTYVWSPNVSTTDSAFNLGVATYNVTITDSKGCTFTTSVNVTAAAGITVSPGTTRNVSCFGGNNGVAHVTVSGGTTPYTYAWTGSASTVDSASNLAQGTYTVTVHDVNGCSGTATFSITQPASAVTAAPVMTQATCGNNNGKVVLHASGGTPGYTYVWSPNVSTTDSALNLGVATYNVTITDSKGCTFATSVNVTAAAGITVTPGATRNVSCFGGNNGVAHVTVTGGTIPYTYAWTGSASTVDSASNLAAGTYTVTVHDVNNCSGTATFTITQPASAVTAAPVMTQATCGNNNGKVVLHASGGTPVYSYIWSPNVSTTDSALNLGVATYNVTITDSKGCTFVTSVNVTAAAGITVTPGPTRNVSCFGGNNGVAHVTVTGGTTPYTYAWTGSASTVDSASNLTQGTYTVTVHDVNGCSGTATFSITQPASAVTAAPVMTQATCGNNNGKVVLHASGGTPGYTYVWSPNVSTTDSALNLGVATYNVTITDSKGCTFVTSVNVTAAAGITVTPGTTRNVSCFGGNNGVAHVTVSGGTTPYTYAWTGSASTVDSASNLAQGTYTVTVHDVNGCSGTATFSITQPASAVTAAPVMTQATCGNNNGKVVLHASGGTPAYSYVWSPNVSTTDSALNLGVATYNVTITDSKGCTFATSVNVTAAAGITVSPGTTRNVSCFGGNNGVAHVTVTGGTTPYTYAWTGSASTVDSASNLAAGTYTVTVHDVNNCSGTATFTITQPASAVTAAPVMTQATCGNNNGKVVLHASGGTPGYTYVWSPNVSTTDSALNLGVTTYNVTITDSKGCTFATSVNVTAAAGITVTPGATRNVSCFGGNNGVAHVTISGGTIPYTYVWTGSASTVDSASNLTQGTYTVTVHDANNCSGTASFTITQPTALGITSATTAATCGNNNGKVVFSVSGGSPAYTYVWSPNVSSVDSAINLGVGSYNVTVTDSKGCTITASATVASSSGFSVSPGVKTDVSCFGGNDGTAHVIATGGTIPYTYVWSPNVSTNDSAVNLMAGTYDVTVHDANNCSGTISFNIAQPAVLGATKTVTQASCGNNNGRIVLNVTGGTPGYSYIWSPNVSTTDSAVNLAANTYSVTVADTKGCTAVASQAITVSPAINVSPGATTNVSCTGGNNGAAHVTVSGGTAPITYIWSPAVSIADSAVNLTAGTYTVTVHDVNNCSGTASFTITEPAAALGTTAATTAATCGNSNGKIVLTTMGGTSGYTYTWSPNVSSVDSAINLAQGTYNVTVRDANGCSTTVSANVSPVGGVSVTLASQQNVTCNGGSNGKIFLNVTGGATPYTYVWSPPVSFNDSAVGLAAGTYSCSVTDNNNCQATITVTITEPLAIAVSVSTTPASCGGSNGTATASVTNGSGTLSYLWSSGGSVTSATDTALAAGSYTVTVTDGNQCSGTGTGAVSNSGAPSVNITTQVNENCHGGSTGKIVLSASGGVPPYTYTWSPNVSSVDSAISLVAGIYTATVHDATNCIAVITTTITEPAAISTTMQSVNADCGVSNGSAIVNATGGTGSYTYVWNPNVGSGDTVSGITSGSYAVTVNDSLGCQAVNSVTVGSNNGPAAPSITASGPTTFCQGDSVILTSSATTGNTWSNGPTTQSITVYSAGTYTVTQTVSGCTSPPSAAVVVTVNPIPAAPQITASGPLAFCPGDSVILTSSYIDGNIWNDGRTTQSITVYAAGTYTVSTIQAGCPSPVSAPVTVSILPALQPQITASKPAICSGDSVILDATTASATGYLWSTSSTLATTVVYTPGTYQVTVTANGCTGTDTISIGTMVPLGTFQLPDSLTLCDGDSVTLNATTLNATSYQWAGVLSTQPVVTIKADGVYYVTVSNACGSLTESSTITFEDCDCRIVMPNAFTPNGDGNNDYFEANFACQAKFFEMRIFNRWGEKVFETTDLYGKWDGKYKGVLQEPEVYVYVATFVGLDHGRERTFRLKGSLTLIR